ncbi:diguanylate cyclase (GGDEF)-like protein [Geodermatophilus bullaregiensis]|uniref:putative bifunctional diguanylate cyclase/phosphodiesterase n=1 Tax=Geodermatophilus bullaregiensis TaxID=1564160 RepID=UPI001958F18C|nr:bifunctional diguanylate cyclase/phosphodiesterase [Geodermatophilus bullaregiensis]MBM7807642.1 diguanylate cyclase (GGDEF)-like protein [Geodermatophilus bullaregiensis]
MLPVLAMVVAQGMLPGTEAGTALYFAVVAVAVAGAWAGALASSRGAAPYCLAVGVTLSGLGDALWQAQALIAGTAADVSAVDVLYVGSYAAVGTGVWLMAGAGERSRRQRVAGAIDALCVTVAALLVVWELSIQATVSDRSLPLVAQAVLVTYPVADAVLLGLVCRLLTSRRRGEWAGLAVAAACACWLVSDVAFLVQDRIEGFGSWLDSGWLLGSLLLTAATSRRLAAPARPARDGVATASGLGRLAVCLGALMVPPSVELVTDATGHGDAVSTVFASTLVLTLLVFLRASLLLKGEAAARARLRSQERYATKLAAWSADAVMVVGRDHRLLSDPAPLAGLLGTAPAELGSTQDVVRAAGIDPDVALDVFGQGVAAGGQVVDVEVPARRMGEDRWYGVRLVDLGDDPDIGGVVVHLTDVTSRRRADRALAHVTLHDGLTGLANRTLFTDRVGQALLRTVRGGGSAAVVTIDLDGFKAVNDTLGHDAGDALLFEVAGRLSAAVRADDTVARLGGDEFAVLVEQAGDGDDAALATATRVLEVLARPVELEGRPVTVTAAVGVAVGRGNVTSGSLIADADLALQAARTGGRNRVEVYDPGMRAAVQAARELEHELRGALAAGEFRLVYQPVVTLADRRVTGFEALLRWTSPRLGPVGPDRFVPAAEAAGLIDEIGAWVLQEACATAAAWRRDHPGAGDMTMAVNVSAAQLASPDLVGSIAAALAESGLPAGSLVVEVTETALVGDPEHAAACLAALRALGVRLALDDFGTGYSSLAHLQQFTVDVLKIDRSFVSTMAEGEPMPAIVRGTIDLGRTLGLEVLAEGVEHEQQARLLAEGNCDSAQGYLFARPLERTDAEAVLLEQVARDAAAAAVPVPRAPRVLTRPV